MDDLQILYVIQCTISGSIGRTEMSMARERATDIAAALSYTYDEVHIYEVHIKECIRIATISSL